MLHVSLAAIWAFAVVTLRYLQNALMAIRMLAAQSDDLITAFEVLPTDTTHLAALRMSRMHALAQGIDMVHGVLAKEID